MANSVRILLSFEPNGTEIFSSPPGRNYTTCQYPNELQHGGFASGFVFAIRVGGGLNGTFLVSLILTQTPAFDSPGTASGGLSFRFNR